MIFATSYSIAMCSNISNIFWLTLAAPFKFCKDFLKIALQETFRKFKFRRSFRKLFSHISMWCAFLSSEWKSFPLEMWITYFVASSFFSICRILSSLCSARLISSHLIASIRSKRRESNIYAILILKWFIHNVIVNFYPFIVYSLPTVAPSDKAASQGAVKRRPCCGSSTMRLTSDSSMENAVSLRNWEWDKPWQSLQDTYSFHFTLH